jgi:MYXO-CTERM domain-containing protein
MIVGVGTLNSLSGSLGEGFGFPDYEDMYLIRITDAAEFSFTLTNAQFDASMWLFNVTRGDEGLGLLGNLDSAPDDFRPGLSAFSNDGSGARVRNPGVYGLAISYGNRRPVSDNGLIFSFGEDNTEISGPDGPGGAFAHTGWIGQGGAGIYSIAITGATFVDVPTPGVASLGLIALGVAAGRRRR